MTRASNPALTSGAPVWLEFVHSASWESFPEAVQAMALRCLTDLIAVAASGSQTECSQLIRSHATMNFAAGLSAPSARLLFDGRFCSPAGAALANGMSIDSIDAHDGYKPAKGHAGCGVIAAALALHEANPIAPEAAATRFLTSLVIGYEIACRAGCSLHDSVPDYHTSGAWVAVAAAAIGARILQLDYQQTREAVGIAEYHGPRSQMMRCIDHPTMLKDGSGWGAMTGVSAAYLARDGFTGAPAISIEADSQAHYFDDLGSRWLILEQYFKPFPVCRWAQPAVVAAMNLQREYHFSHTDIQSVSIGTFHESARLATAQPSTTEEAQYSLAFPVAVVLVTGKLTVNDIDGKALHQPDVLRLSKAIKIEEVQAYDAVFPEQRISHITITLKDGRCLQSGPTEADGDPESPLTDAVLREKFVRLTEPVLHETRCHTLLRQIDVLTSKSAALEGLMSLLYAPIR